MKELCCCGQVMGEVDKNGYKNLDVLESADKSKKMKEKVKLDYLRRVKLVARLKLYSGKLIKVINAWAIGVVRYSAGILDWSAQELQAMDMKMRETLAMFGRSTRRGV